MSALLREPLVWFLLAGAVLFGLSNWRANDPDSVIVVSDAEVSRIRDQWQAQMGRPATKAELDGLIDQWIQEEVYYREASRLGLDQGDTIVRRRLVQKLRFLTEDIATAILPDEAQLREFHAAHVDRYTLPQRFSLRHRFFSSDRRADARADARQALTDPEDPGDPFMLQKSFADRSARQLGELFGRSFAEALPALPVGEWAGPVESAYGWHLVFVEATQPAQPQPLQQVRERVVADWQQQRRQEANEAYYESLRAQYQVERG